MSVFTCVFFFRVQSTQPPSSSCLQVCRSTQLMSNDLNIIEGFCRRHFGICFFFFKFRLVLIFVEISYAVGDVIKSNFQFFFFFFLTWTRRWTGGNFSEREEGAGVIRFVSCPSQTVRIEWPAARHTINTLSAIFRTTLIQLVIMSLIKQPLLRLPQRCRVQFL